MLFTTVKYKMLYFNENMACVPISFLTSIPSGCVFFFWFGRSCEMSTKETVMTMWLCWVSFFFFFFFFSSPSSKVNVVFRIWVLYSCHLVFMPTAFFLMVRNTQYFSLSITVINWNVINLHGFLYYVFLGLQILKIHCSFHIFVLV